MTKVNSVSMQYFKTHGTIFISYSSGEQEMINFSNNEDMLEYGHADQHLDKILDVFKELMIQVKGVEE